MRHVRALFFNAFARTIPSQTGGCVGNLADIAPYIGPRPLQRIAVVI